MIPLMNVLIFFSLFSKRRVFEISCCCMMHCRSKVLWGKNGLSFLICARTDAFPLYKICRHGIRNLTEAINSNWIWRWKSRYQERERPWWEHWQLLRAIAATLPSSLSPHWFNQSSCLWIQWDPWWLPWESVYGCQSAKSRGQDQQPPHNSVLPSLCIHSLPNSCHVAKDQVCKWTQFIWPTMAKRSQQSRKIMTGP